MMCYTHTEQAWIMFGLGSAGLVIGAAVMWFIMRNK